MQGIPLHHVPAPHRLHPPWCQLGGFRAGKGCGQTGSKARPRVRLWLFLADETPSLRHNFLAFCPGHSLSILVLALREGFGDGGGWELISIVRGMEVTCFAAGETQWSLLRAGSFSTAVSPV